MTVLSMLLDSDEDFEVRYLHFLIEFLSLGTTTTKVGVGFGFCFCAEMWDNDSLFFPLVGQPLTCFFVYESRSFV